MAAELLTQGVLAHQALQLTHELVVSSRREIMLYAIFEAAEVELLEASDLGLSEPVVGELGKRRSAPE